MHTITPIVVLLTLAASATSLAQGPTDSISRQPQFPTLTDSQWVRLATPDSVAPKGDC